MQVFVGDTRGQGVGFLQEQGWGRMFASDRSIPQLYPYEPWAFDNGAFKTWAGANYQRDLTIDDWVILFDVEKFKKRLAAALKVNSDPCVAVVPDIPGSKHSLEYSLSWLPELPSYWRWYLAVQDGMTHKEVLKVASLFNGIFLGGTDRFKLTAYGWCRLAHFCDKKFHYGRAGTLRKIRHAWKVEADSLDSNFPLWTKQRMVELRDELKALKEEEQRVLVK